MFRFDKLSAIFCLLISFSAQAQSSCDYSISGKVISEDYLEPIPFVKVKLDNELQVYTDIEGSFEFKNVCQTEHQLSFSAFSYQDTTFIVKQSTESTLTVKMKFQTVVSDSCVLSSDNQLSNYTEENTAVQETKTQEELAQYNELESVLESFNGVSVAKVSANINIPIIHGMYASRILMLNNGYRHGYQTWGTEHGPTYNFYAANSITVVSGAAAVQYGADAFGGVILTEQFPLNFSTPLQAKVRTGLISNGRGTKSSLILTKGRKKLSYHLAGFYERSGDRYTPDYLMTNTGEQQYGLDAGLGYAFSDKLDLKVSYEYLNFNSGILLSSFTHSMQSLILAIEEDQPLIVEDFSYEISKPNQFVQHHFLHSELNWYYRSDAMLQFKVGRQLNKREEYDVRRSSHLPIIDMDLTTDDIQAIWHHPEVKSWNGRMGVQLFNQSNENIPGTNITPLVPNYTLGRYSAFLIEHLLKQKFEMEFGLRFDHEITKIAGRTIGQDLFKDDYSLTNFSASLGLLKKLKKYNYLRTNIGTAWRTPDMFDLYGYGQHGFVSSFGILRYQWQGEVLNTNDVLLFEDQNVEPEKSIKWTAQLGTSNSNHPSGIVFYSQYVQNYVQCRPATLTNTIRGPLPVFLTEQVNALFVGADFNSKHNLLAGITGELKSSFVWGHNVQSDDLLIGLPPVSTSYHLAWRSEKEVKPNKKRVFEVYLEPQLVLKQYFAPRTIQPSEILNGEVRLSQEDKVFDFKDAPDSYFLLHGGVNFIYDKWQVNAGVRNALNATYRNYLDRTRYFSDAVGINAFINVQLNLN